MHTNRAPRSVADRAKSRGWVFELTLFAMLAPAMIADFLSIGTFAGF